MSAVAQKMARLRLQFDKVRQDLLPTIVQSVADRALQLAKRGFEDGVSPYDSPWAPTKDGGVPLNGTGRLERSYQMRLEGGRFGSMRFVIFTNVLYALFNQGPSARKGGHIAPGRPQLPAKNKLGKTWAKELRAAANDAMASVSQSAGGGGGGSSKKSGGGPVRGAGGRFQKK